MAAMSNNELSIGNLTLYDLDQYDSREIRKLRDGKTRLSGYCEYTRSNRKYVLAAVSSDQYALKYANTKWRDDKEVVIAAISFNGNALEFASERLQNDKDIAMIIAISFPHSIIYLSYDMRDNYEAMYAAVCKNGYVLRFASERIRADKKIVIIALAYYGLALDCVSPDLYNDFDVIFAAVSSDGDALYYASDALRNNSTIVFAALETNKSSVLGCRSILEYIGNDLLTDRDFALKSVEYDGTMLKYLPNFSTDTEIVEKAITVDGYALNFVADKFKNVKELVLLAMRTNIDNIVYASKELSTGGMLKYIRYLQHGYIKMKYLLYYSSNKKNNILSKLNLHGVHEGKKLKNLIASFLIIYPVFEPNGLNKYTLSEDFKSTNGYFWDILKKVVKKLTLKFTFSL